MTHTTATLSGLAADWSPVDHDGATSRYMPTCFDSFIQRAESRWIRLEIEHSGFCLSVPCGISFQANERGLHISCDVRLVDDQSRAAILAVRHGHLTALSVRSVHRASHVDHANNSVTVFDSDLTEISLTASPRNPRTYVTISGQDVPRSKSMPTNASDQQLLTRFLDKFHLRPSSKAVVIPSASTSPQSPWQAPPKPASPQKIAQADAWLREFDAESKRLNADYFARYRTTSRHHLTAQ